MDVFIVSVYRLEYAHQNVYEPRHVCGSLEAAREKAKSLCSDLAGTFIQTSVDEWNYDVGADYPVKVSRMPLEDPADTGLKELCEVSSKIALEHGWKNDFVTQMLLTITEISEAVEEFRNHRRLDEIWYSKTMKSEDGSSSTTTASSAGEPGAKPEGIPIELADAMIRICDFCGQNGVDLLKAVRIKTEFNRTRSYRHGGKRV